MPRFVIEREIPGIGRMKAKDLEQVARRSCAVLEELGPQVRWERSYISENKMYCVYVAPGEELVFERANRDAFPADRISRVLRRCDPSMAASHTRAPRQRDLTAETAETRREEAAHDADGTSAPPMAAQLVDTRRPSAALGGEYPAA